MFLASFYLVTTVQKKLAQQGQVDSNAKVDNARRNELNAVLSRENREIVNLMM